MPDQAIEFVDRDWPIGPKLRVRMTEAAGWLHVIRPHMSSWKLAAVEFDGAADQLMPVGVPGSMQSSTTYGLSAEVRDELDTFVRADRDARRAAARAA